MIFGSAPCGIERFSIRKLFKDSGKKKLQTYRPSSSSCSSSKRFSFGLGFSSMLSLALKYLLLPELAESFELRLSFEDLFRIVVFNSFSISFKAAFRKLILSRIFCSARSFFIYFEFHFLERNFEFQYLVFGK